MQQHGSKYFARRLPPPLPESQMQRHASTYSVLTHTLGPWGGGQRSKQLFFSESSHTKIKGMEHGAPCKNIFCPYTHHQPVDYKKVKKI